MPDRSPTTDVRIRPRLGRGRSPGAVAVVIVMSALLVGSLVACGRGPSPSIPSAPSSETSIASAAGPSPSVSGDCVVSVGAIHGTWWREIGGPNAYFNWDGGPRRLTSAPWKVHLRFDPDASPDEAVSTWADNLDSGERVVGTLNGPADPAHIFRFDHAAPDLPGGWYLFLQALPSTGCWRLSAAIDGKVVGTAVVSVVDQAAAGATPAPRLQPTPEPEPTPWPEYTFAPAVDDVLLLAGRDGVPGMLSCANMPFPVDTLAAPLGAEVRIGPEFDALRSYTVGAPERDGAIGVSFREVSRDAHNVLFLHEPSGPGVVEAGPFLAAKVTSNGTSWRYTGGGDCQPQGLPGTGFGQATWTLDPAFRAPNAESRTLHLLVQEVACSGGRSASGRISPAFVVESRHEVAIELFVQTHPGEGDCQANPPTPATLRLPVPLGDRSLLDAGAIGLGGAGG